MNLYGIFSHIDKRGDEKLIVLLCILGCMFFGIFAFAIFGDVFGVAIVLGIVLGCLVRSLYLITKIHNHLLKDEPKKDKVKEAYQKYLQESKIVRE